MKNINIAGRDIGANQPCFIIAEAGSNHNGQISDAKKLVSVAADAGADAIKFQNFKAAKLYARGAGKSAYLKSKKSINAIIKEMEMPDDWVPELADFCRSKKIIFCSSPFDEQAADLLEPYVPFYKIASYEMGHFPLLRHVALKRKPVIVSTGTANLDEVAKMVDVFLATGNDSLALMQCTAKYPAPLETLNISAIRTMASEFGLPVGLSDHSREPLIGPVVAIGAGACIIEKHFTLSNDLPGPDHAFAVEPHELEAMVAAIRLAEKALGTGTKEVLPAERELRDFTKRCIFATRAIRQGERFTTDNVAILRKGELSAGLSPGQWDNILGQRAAEDISADTPLQAHHLSNPG